MCQITNDDINSSKAEIKQGMHVRICDIDSERSGIILSMVMMLCFSSLGRVTKESKQMCCGL